MAFTKQKEFEIRARYEFGENLNDLAIIYKIPLVTIKKRKKKAELKGDPWIKNSRSKDGYKRYINESDKKKAEIEKRINEKVNHQLLELEDDIAIKYSITKSILSDGIERSALTRFSRIKKIADLRKSIENIPATTNEKLVIEKLKLENETKKLEYEEKKRDLDMKKEMLNNDIG
ncbi:hypothetical protein [Fusobacterium sp. IOR10]|uniref:hypothetical protein n=1 Tax=Fusobacterium sp. IOR10 TaxID=2665157 RepID=UPI0013D2D7BC|nr:hypothetical protein [Fusobacterium sp. IOR10]